MDSLQAHKKAIHKTKVAFRAAWWFGCFNKNLRQLQKIRNFNPKNNINNIKIPFLFIFGESDALVHPQNSITRLKEIFANQLPKNITTAIIPRANHSFLEAEKCYKGKSSLLNYSEKFKMEFRNYLLRCFN